MIKATDVALADAVVLLRRARTAIAFTGAGISVESGIPHFRGEGGLWTKFDPYKVAHIDTFRKDPAQYWTYSRNHRRADAQPNPAHRALVELERLGHLLAVVTQNTDGLHQKAGSSEVIELHGSSHGVVCLHCETRLPREQGADLCIVNAEPTPFDPLADVVLHGKAGEILPEIVRQVAEP